MTKTVKDQPVMYILDMYLKGYLTPREKLAAREGATKMEAWDWT